MHGEHADLLIQSAQVRYFQQFRLKHKGVAAVRAKETRALNTVFGIALQIENMTATAVTGDVGEAGAIGAARVDFLTLGLMLGQAVIQFTVWIRRLKA